MYGCNTSYILFEEKGPDQLFVLFIINFTSYALKRHNLHKVLIAKRTYRNK